MTETLRDLLHEAVSDSDMPDVSDLAWAAGGRARRRRAGLGRRGRCRCDDDGRRGGLGRRPPRRTPSGAADPCAVTQHADHHGPRSAPSGPREGRAGWRVPRYVRVVGAERRARGFLAGVPPRCCQPAADHHRRLGSGQRGRGEPVGLALASFAVYAADGSLSAVHVLGADGLLRRVDLVPATGKGSPIKPMPDPEGNQRIQAGFSMLSPSGEYLMFPQDGFIRLLRLESQQWSIHRHRRALDVGRDLDRGRSDRAPGS